MSTLVRVGFYSLAVVLTQLALPAGATTPAAAGGGAAERVDVRSAPHAASYGARTVLSDREADRLPDASFAPADRPGARGIATVVVAAAPKSTHRAFGVAFLLPPSRAPPAHS